MKKQYLALYMILYIILSGCSLKQISTITGNEYVFGETYMILYFKEAGGTYLVPESRVVNIDGRRIEEVIIEEIIKGPKTMNCLGVVPKETKLISAKIKGKTAHIYLHRSDELILQLSQEAINSIVNSLTELPHINGVRIYIDGRQFGSTYKRERSALKRENLNPSQVLKKQMEFEKSEDWLNAYMLMSDSENSQGRKSYDEYVKEMQKVKKEGLLNADFKVGEYTIDPINKNKSRVKVNFIIINYDGSKYESPDIFFSCVKVDGYWMVDWLTNQNM